MRHVGLVDERAILQRVLGLDIVATVVCVVVTSVVAHTRRHDDHRLIAHGALIAEHFDDAHVRHGLVGSVGGRVDARAELGEEGERVGERGLELAREREIHDAVVEELRAAELAIERLTGGLLAAHKALGVEELGQVAIDRLGARLARVRAQEALVVVPNGGHEAQKGLAYRQLEQALLSLHASQLGLLTLKILDKSGKNCIKEGRTTFEEKVSIAQIILIDQSIIFRFKYQYGKKTQTTPTLLYPF